MKLGKLLLGAIILFSSISFAQDDECTRYQTIAGYAYKEKNYEKVTMAYNKALAECEKLDMKFINPFLYSVKMAMKNAPSNEAKAAYLDTLIYVYEKAQEQHGLQKDWQAYLGYSYMTKGDMVKADEAYRIGVHHEGPKINVGMMKQYYSNIYNLWIKEEGEAKKNEYKKRLIEEYFKLSEYVNEAGMGAETLEFLAIYLDKAVTDCASVLPSINEFMKQLPQDAETKKTTVTNFMSLLEKKDCTSSDEYAMLVDTIIAINPNSVDAILIKAKLLIAQNKTSEAIKVYEDVLSKSTDEDQISDIEYEIAKAYFTKRNYKAAHNAGLKVSGKNAGIGYEIAAKSVNALANECGVSTFQRKANNYYAVQLAEKSGNSALINAYKKQCPTSSDAFNDTVEAGQQVELECWGRTVTVVFY